MTKFASLKKVHMKIIMVKRNLELNDFGISLLFSKSMPSFDRDYIGSFFNLYMALP